MRRIALALLLHACADVHMASDIILAPLGLITSPNKFGQYRPGALAVADNAVMRSRGIITQASADTPYNSSPIADSPSPHVALLVEADQMMLVIAQRASGGWEVDFFDGSTIFSKNLNLAEPYAAFNTVGQVSFTRNRERILVNATDQIVVFDNLHPSSSSEANPRRAALKAPRLTDITPVTTGSPGAVGASECTALSALVRRVFDDGYEVFSSPSPPVFFGTGAAADIQISVYWGTTLGYAAGDVIELYRTRKRPLQTPVGPTFFKSMAYTLTATDISNGYVTLVDSCPDSSMAEELYTNPGHAGASGAHRPPPVANVLSTFKGYSFFWDRTEFASIRLSVPGGLNFSMPASNAYIRKNGIGQRLPTATFTSGSNTLTGISAADIIGVAVGQRAASAQLVGGGGYVTAVGASTVTLDTTANANVTQTVSISDVVLIDGSAFTVHNWEGFATLVASDKRLQVYASSIDPIAGSASDNSYSPREFTIAADGYRLGSFTIAASNPQNYVPRLPGTTDTPLTVSPKYMPNGVSWSEEGQPEAVPDFNQATVGSGRVLGVAATRDAQWVFCTDGLWRWSGNGGSAGAEGFDWRKDLVDSTLVLAAPGAISVLRDTAYAYTSRGLVAINDTGIKELSAGRIDDLLPGQQFAATSTITMTADETHDEILLHINTTGTNGRTYIYNTHSDAFTTRDWFSYNSYMRKRYARYLNDVVSITGSSALKTHAGSTVLEMTLDFQPVYGSDPTALKMWQDMMVLASPSSSGRSVSARFNQALVSSARTLQVVSSNGKFSQANFGVPRDAPSVSHLIMPGIFAESSLSGPVSLYSVSLRSAAASAMGAVR